MFLNWKYAYRLFLPCLADYDYFGSSTPLRFWDRSPKKTDKQTNEQDAYNAAYMTTELCMVIS